ncbi:hypothetical protein FACS189443_2940 [Planctomycetales bacterium]|nr:hypothetical protein FACS189443_2940 [Planctomycetales bacterium]
MPIQLEAVLRKVPRALPDSSVIANIAENIASTIRHDLTDKDEQVKALFPDNVREKVFHAAQGLSETDVEDSFVIAHTYSRDGTVQPQFIFDMKAKFVSKSSALELYNRSEGFESLGGLEALKVFLIRSLKDRADMNMFPRVVLLTGVSGTGKSAIARSLAKEVGLPAVKLSIGRLLGSLVGDSEKFTQRALEIIDQTSPCVLIIDEIEKGLSGSDARGSASDGGTMRRVVGTILTWMQDKTSDVYVVGSLFD